MDLNAAYLIRHQQLQSSLLQPDVKNDPSSLANNLRNLYLHQKSFCQSRSENISSDNFTGLLRQYADIVDNMEVGGLNNFADGALTLCQYAKNESVKWESSLTMENMCQLPCIAEAIRNDIPELDKEDIEITLEASSRPTKSSGANPSGSNNSVKDVKVINPSVDGRTNPTVQHNKQQPHFQQIQRPAHNASPGWASTGFPTTAANTRLQRPPPPTTVQPLRDQNQHNLSTVPRLSVPSRQSRDNIAPSVQRVGAAVQQSKQIQSNKDTEMDVSASRVGGPYANFGQKRKNPQSTLYNNNKANKKWMKGGSCEDDDSAGEEQDNTNKPGPFKTARDQLIINVQKKGGGSSVGGANYGAAKKSLGTRRGPASKFVPPVLHKESDEPEGSSLHGQRSARGQEFGGQDENEPVDERLKGIDPKMIELINNEIMDTSSALTWSDIAGLEFAKKTIQEIVVWPMLRPDIFTGLRGPPKGLLLFGPPGTGKTLIGKCVANQSKSTFFCISASSLTSKWVGEGEKMVRTLFAVARCHQPAVIFIDEIDSLLSQRSDSEHESSRRIKTEFLVQLDGATTESEDRILVIGATNRPQEIDEAARRRFVKRLHIPLPEAVARRQIVVNLMSQQNSNLDEDSVQWICDKTDGYSGADMTNLCREAALGPIRSIPFDKMETITPDQVRSIQLADFEQALLQVRASVSDKDLELYKEWNKTYGSFGH